MKNTILKLCSLLVISVLLISLSGCKKYDGSIDEIYGIYGLNSTYFYRDYIDEDNTITTNFSELFEYIVVVLRENRTADFYYKLDGQDEVSYSTTYEVFFKEDNPETEENEAIAVDHLIFKEVKFLDRSKALAENPVYELVSHEDVKFNYGIKLRKLKYSDITIKKLIPLRTEGTKLQFSKKENKISDKKINKVKEELKKNWDERKTIDSSELNSAD